MSRMAPEYLNDVDRYRPWKRKRERDMKKIILVGALAVLAACGSSSNGGSANTAADQSSASEPAADSSGDTISVSDFGDMPPQCIDLLSTFLKQIEPTVSKIDWKNVFCRALSACAAARAEISWMVPTKKRRP